MSIPSIIEATDNVISKSVSLITLESVLSDSSIRFQHKEEKFGRRMSQGPVVKPTRKRSSHELLVVFELHDTVPVTNNGNLRNATFPDDDTRKSARLARLESVLSSDASYSSSITPRAKSPPCKDPLLERYMKLVEEAKSKAPQKPRRKSSSSRITASTMPLAMPVRKASMADGLHGLFPNHRRRESV
ncbi:unnamed protein product [Cylindrotheca closterium]|uniref:Uncharacterized protein n=1 Tax=Cylindrotheca closterium TaxID=2856 RepID=A0AAD2G6M1_9STRA|nr:unnamed protein product [Cylindrotheca closterium]